MFVVFVFGTSVVEIVSEFADGESIITEYSHKYTLDGFADMTSAAGFRVEQVWTDPREWFSVQYCVRD